MARTKMNQRSANRVAVPMGATGGRTPPSKITVLLLGTSIISAVWAAAMLTPFGRVAYVYFFAYSEFYMGVLSLVALSITIMIGLVATDRLVLSIRQRVLLQSAHRTTGVIAVAALGLHLWTKLMEGHIRVIDMFIPFLVPGYNRVYVGLGTISGIVMFMVMWTGLVRARFVGRGKPWMWRSIHAISYLMWPIALVHGLSAGRAAATWVTVSYVVCVLLVLIGLAVRLSVSLNRRKDFASTSTGSIKPVGSLVPTNPPSMKKRAGRRSAADPMDARVVADRSNAPAAALESWVPAARPVSAPAASPVSARPAPGSASPISGPPISSPPYDDGQYRRESRSARYADEEETAPRSRRYADDDAPRGRRRAEPRYDEPYDERRYAAAGEPPPGRRRVDDDARYGADSSYDDEPRRSRRPPDATRATRSTRYADEAGPDPRHGDDTPRGRRYADGLTPRSRRQAEDEPGYDQAPTSRSRRRTDEERDEDVRRRRSTGDVRTTGEFASGEYRTGEFRYDSGPAVPRSRSSRHAEDDSPAPRTRRDRGAKIDRADSGRHSRSEFVDLSAPADPWGSTADPNYLPPDDTPTLIDMASRRARKASQQQDAARGASRGARRTRSRSDENDVADAQYWRQLRGEAQ
jgi:hypothetical protein